MPIPKLIRVVSVNKNARTPHYLTCGKTYEVVQARVNPSGWIAAIIDDEGDMDWILHRGCAHGYTYEVVE